MFIEFIKDLLLEQRRKKANAIKSIARRNVPLTHNTTVSMHYYVLSTTVSDEK